MLPTGASADAELFCCWGRASHAARRPFGSGGGLAAPIAVLTTIGDMDRIPPGCIPVLQVGPALPEVPYGVVSAVAGEFAGRCVVWAADAALRGDIAALVTAPLHKEAMSAAGAPYNAYPGHTELLQARAANARGLSIDEMPVRMMLANHELRTVLVSIHVSLRQALEAITFDNIVDTLRITRVALRNALGREPRIAVAGLNPHAGRAVCLGKRRPKLSNLRLRRSGLRGRMSTALLHPILFLCAQGIQATTPVNLMWWWRCTTTKGSSRSNTWEWSKV